MIGFFNTGGRILSGAITDHPKVDALALTTLAIFSGKYKEIYVECNDDEIIFRSDLSGLDDVLLPLLVLLHRLRHVRSLPVSLAGSDLLSAGEQLANISSTKTYSRLIFSGWSISLQPSAFSPASEASQPSLDRPLADSSSTPPVQRRL